MVYFVREMKFSKHYYNKHTITIILLCSEVVHMDEINFLDGLEAAEAVAFAAGPASVRRASSSSGSAAAPVRQVGSPWTVKREVKAKVEFDGDEQSDVVSCPSAKKPRTRRRGLCLAKCEGADVQVHGHGSEFGIIEAHDMGEDEEDKPCTGCQRSTLSGHDWWGRGRVPWALPDCMGALVQGLLQLLALDVFHPRDTLSVRQLVEGQ